MNGTDQIMRQYEALGISKEVYAFGSKVEESLKERFLQVDKTAEFNQLKVLGAMQRQKVSAAFTLRTDTGTTTLAETR